MSRRFILDAHRYADALMLATGAYAPLNGFLGPEDYQAVLDDCRLASGELWSLPITLPSEQPYRRGPLPLCWRGQEVGVLDVQGSYRIDPRQEALAVYQTTSELHIGVRQLYAQPLWRLYGAVQLWASDSADSPAQVRAELRARGWQTIAAFQTRNPLHRGHEYLHQQALKQVDGLLLHPLTGPTQPDDLPASLRMATYRAVLPFYPAGRVLLRPYPAAMRYAGPREALLHALSRRNYGATHLLVGRDHAGVGGFYAPEAAQEFLKGLSPQELGLSLIFLPEVQYCPGCGAVTTSEACPHDPQQRLALSGQAIRARLRAGELPPAEWLRPEVARLLLAELSSSSE